MKTSKIQIMVLFLFAIVPLLVGKIFYLVDLTYADSEDIYGFLFVVVLALFPFYVWLRNNQRKPLGNVASTMRSIIEDNENVDWEKEQASPFLAVYELLDKEIKTAHNKDKEIAEISAMQDLFLAFDDDKFFQINITDDKFLYGLDQWPAFQALERPEVTSFTEVISLVSMSLVHPTQISDFVKFFNRDNLINLDKRGRSKINFECRIKNENNKFIWVRFCLRLKFKLHNIALFADMCIKDISLEKKLEQDLLDKEQLDILTGVYTKASGRKLVERYLDSDSGACAFAILGIHGYENLNKMFGSKTTNQAIQEIAGQIKEAYSGHAIISRNAENELVILFKVFSDKEDLAKDLSNILLMSKKSFFKDGEEYNMIANIGVATFPNDGVNYSQLSSRATTALQEAYLQNSNGYSFYEYKEQTETEIWR